MAPAEFQHVILYMYSGAVDLHSVEELCFGIYGARRFSLEALKQVCLERLQKLMQDDSEITLRVLQLDQRFHNCKEDEALRTVVHDNISKNYRAVVNSEVITTIDADAMKTLLEMETDQDVPEIEVFRALLKWTKAVCFNKGLPLTSKELQAVAEDLTFFVRYTFIPPAELLGEVAASGLLTDQYIVMILQSSFN